MCVAAQSVACPVAGSFVVGDRSAVIIGGESVRQCLVKIDVVVDDAFAVVFDEFCRQWTDRVERETILVLGYALRVLRVQSTVVEKNQRLAVDAYGAVVAFQLALCEVPVGYVVAGVAQNEGAGK